MANGARTLEIKDIFEKERFPKSNWQFVSLFAYFPVGVVLAVLRFCIGLHACLAALILTHTPYIRNIVLKTVCMVLGISVDHVTRKRRDKSARVIIANCVTRLDHIAFHLTTDCICHTKWDGIFPVELIPGLTDFSKGGNTLDNLRLHVESSETPLFLQPEEATSGKDCLLKFSTKASEICNTVQPVAVTVERPVWANTAPTVLGSSFSLDLFWFLFSPWTVFKIRYLEVLHRESDESDESFTERMQASIASALSMKTTSFTASDKAEYEKRYLDELREPLVMSSPLPYPMAGSPEVMRMSLQVSEVLPYVPRDVIVRDLSRTKSVDMTISNILEGVVQYTPIQAQSSIQRSPPQSSSSPPEVFSKSSNDRMASFRERKIKMIEEARRRYIERKGLTGI